LINYYYVIKRKGDIPLNNYYYVIKESVFSEFSYMLNRRSPDAAPSIRIAPELRRSAKLSFSSNILSRPIFITQIRGLSIIRTGSNAKLLVMGVPIEPSENQKPQTLENS
jgi:hypothetical protein